MDVMNLSKDHDSSYACRGTRVVRMTKRDIEAYAKRFCMALQLKDGATKGMPIILALEALRATHNIPLDINPIEDEKWNLFGIADAVCDPDNMSVYMPNSLYEQAANNDPEALQILFHEIGHIFLVHKPLLHHSSGTKPVREEDAEWQADAFADAVMACIMPKKSNMQLELF